MPIFNKPIESITEVDLLALKENGVSEGKLIDYKISLPGRTDSDKKEFLYDVSSFANASGGHLIFGIEETGGVPINIPGLEIPDADAEKGRLENMIRDGIDPRIPGIHIAALALKNSKKAVIISIPKSWASPHMIKFQKDSRFYSRNSAGKYPLDAGEIRSAFLLSETTLEKLRRFRLERLGAVVSGETPIPIEFGPKMILHLIPLNAFDPSKKLNSEFLFEQTKGLFPPSASGRSTRFNFDGFLIYEKPFQVQGLVTSYLQVFRNGIFEALTTRFVFHEEKKYFRRDFEETWIDAVRQYFGGLKKLGIDPPLFVILSLLEVKGCAIPPRQAFTYEEEIAIESNSLLISEELVETFESDPAEILKPIFDSVWNACGVRASPNYGEDGKWIPR